MSISLSAFDEGNQKLGQWKSNYNQSKNSQQQAANFAASCASLWQEIITLIGNDQGIRDATGLEVATLMTADLPTLIANDVTMNQVYAGGLGQTGAYLLAETIKGVAANESKTTAQVMTEIQAFLDA